MVWSAMFEGYPYNGYALFGLERSLRAQGKDKEAEAVAERIARVPVTGRRMSTGGALHANVAET